MEFTIAVGLKENYVFMEPAGPISSDNLLKMAEAVRKHCDEHKLTRALINSGAITGAMSPTELFFASQKWSEIVGPKIKVAYYNIPPHWKPEDDKLSRNVIKNRTGIIEMFETKEGALKWLEGVE